MKDENGKITIKSIWKWLRSDTGKKASFFIFYFFFFLFIFMFLSSGDNQTTPQQEEETSFPYSITNIEANNYSFSYILTINDTNYEYLGERDNNTLTINDDTGIYTYSYQNGNLIFEGVDNPLKYPEFLNIYDLKTILKTATLQSETKLTTTNEYIYTYEIKNSQLLNLLNLTTDLSIDIDLDNEIIVKTNSNKEFQEIQLDILNFMKIVENAELNTYTITLTYGDTYE